jgi:hypothetical protein
LGPITGAEFPWMRRAAPEEVMRCQRSD